MKSSQCCSSKLMSGVTLDVTSFWAEDSLANERKPAVQFVGPIERRFDVHRYHVRERLSFPHGIYPLAHLINVALKGFSPRWCLIDYQIGRREITNDNPQYAIDVASGRDQLHLKHTHDTSNG